MQFLDLGFISLVRDRLNKFISSVVLETAEVEEDLLAPRLQFLGVHQIAHTLPGLTGGEGTGGISTTDPTNIKASRGDSIQSLPA